MATEVRHGPHPVFKAPLGRGRYGLTVKGRYTTMPGLTAAGVTHVRWNSNRPAKRQAEMLGMRTAFVCWFMATWTQLGGSWAGGVRALSEYPYRRLKRQVRRKRALSVKVLMQRAQRDVEHIRLGVRKG